MLSPSNGIRGAAITAMGHALPTVELDNAALIERCGLDVTPEWIESRTGIKRRHWLADGVTTSDLAVEAAEKAMAARGIASSDVDRIVLATISPDMPSPSTATIVARKLGARCPAFDLSAACSGFIYGLDLAAATASMRGETVLLLAADARSRFIDQRDRRGAVLFSDGAAAAIVEPSVRPGVLGVFLGAEGREDPGVHMPAGGAALPTSAVTVAAGLHHLVVDPAKDIFELFIRYTREAVEGALAAAECTMDDVDAFIAHQGNATMIDMVRDDLAIPRDIVINEVHRHGNTSGASIPLVLAEAVEEGRLHDGETVLLASVGAGYTFAAAVIRLGAGPR